MHDLLFIFYAAFAIILLALAAPPHFRSGNIGAIFLVLWSFIGCLGFFVNAIVWWDNVENHAPVWCDIWTKLTIGLTTGISSACLCINRRLKIISSARRSSLSPKERRWSFWIDIAIAIVPPVFFMACHYTVQGNRFNIAESYGCQAATYTDWHGVLEVYVPPLILGVISFVYGGISVYNFSARRRQFQSVLQQSGGGLNTSRFVRLIALSLLEMLLTVPLAIWSIAYTFQYALKPTLSWSDTHADFSRVDVFTEAALMAAGSDVLSRATLQRWIPVFAAFAYFCFFGAQEEALVSYWNAFNRLKNAKFGKKSRVDAESNDAFLRVPQLGNTIGPVSPTNPVFPNRSAEDLQKGGLSLTVTEDGEKEQSLGFGHKKSGIAVRVERNVVEE